jgi:expansin
MRVAVVCFLVSAWAWGCHDDGAPDNGGGLHIELGETFEGEGTYYDFADGSGACSFDPSPEDMNVAALNSRQWAGSAWCGACADVTGPNGSVRVRIVDLCPECPHGNLDFSPEAFDQIADRAAGRVEISWQFVACDVSGPIVYKYKDGANQWWTAVQIRNHRLPVTALEWSPDGDEWHTTTRTDYNYFLDDSGFGPSPVQVRVTAVDGQVLEDSLPAVQEMLEVQGKSQFD